MNCPAGPQGRVRRSSVPRMREPNGKPTGRALMAPRSIAQMVCSVDMALERPSCPTVKLAGFGKTRVNRLQEARASTGKDWAESSAGIGQHCCLVRARRRLYGVGAAAHRRGTVPQTQPARLCRLLPTGPRPSRSRHLVTPPPERPYVRINVAPPAMPCGPCAVP